MVGLMHVVLMVETKVVVCSQVHALGKRGEASHVHCRLIAELFSIGKSSFFHILFLSSKSISRMSFHPRYFILLELGIMSSGN
jgi:hypothetical protein